MSLDKRKGTRTTVRNNTDKSQTVTYSVKIPPHAERTVHHSDQDERKRKLLASLGAFTMCSRLELYNISARRTVKGTSAMRLLLYFSAMMGYNNTYATTIDILASELGTSERDIRRGLNELVKAELLKKLRLCENGPFTYFVNPHAMGRGDEVWLQSVQQAWDSGSWPPPSDRDRKRHMLANYDQQRRGLAGPRNRNTLSGPPNLKLVR